MGITGKKISDAATTNDSTGASAGLSGPDPDVVTDNTPLVCRGIWIQELGNNITHSIVCISVYRDRPIIAILRFEILLIFDF